MVRNSVEKNKQSSMKVEEVTRKKASRKRKIEIEIKIPCRNFTNTVLFPSKSKRRILLTLENEIATERPGRTVSKQKLFGLH